MDRYRSTRERIYALSARGTRSYSFTTERTSPQWSVLLLRRDLLRMYGTRLGRVVGGAPKVIEDRRRDGSVVEKYFREYKKTTRRKRSKEKENPNDQSLTFFRSAR